METIREIIKISALGFLSKWYKMLVILLFSTIVVTLFVMLFALCINGSNSAINFGYLYNNGI